MMLSDTIIVGLLSLFGTAIGSWSGMKLMSYRLEQLEKKVDQHNSFAEKIPLLEEKIKQIVQKMDEVERRLEKAEN